MPNISEYNLPSTASRTALQIQKRLNERSKRAMNQREETPELLPTKEDVNQLSLASDRPEIIANKNRKAISIQIQLQNMANNQIVDNLDWKPSVIKSETTQRMIDEYRAEQRQPVKVFDPKRNKEVVFKYHPSSVDLTPVIPLVDGTLTETQIKNYKRIRINEAIKYSSYEKQLSVEVPAERQRIIDEFNHAKLSEKDATYFLQLKDEINALNRHREALNLAEKLGIVLPPTDNTLRKKKTRLLAEVQRQAELPFESTAEARFHGENARLDEIIANLEAQKIEAKGIIDDINYQLNENKRRIHQNNINAVEAGKQTQSRNAQAVDELKLLNTGKAIPDQQSGETDDEYRQRLINIGDVVLDDEEVQREAEALQIVRAKYNFREFLSDDAKIETIIKKLTPDDLTVFNTSFPAYKKKYIETYGFNNRNMSVDKIVEFVKTPLSIPTAPPLAPLAQPLAEPEKVSPVGSTAFERIKNYARDQHGINTSGKKLSQIVREIEGTGSQVPFPLIRDLRKGDREALMSEGLIEYYNPPTPVSRAKPAVSVGPLDGKGIGIHLKKMPRTVQFGKIHIKPSNLYYESILSIRTKAGAPLRAYRDEKVSNYLASLIMKLLEGGKVSKHELSALSEREIMIYDNLIRRSKLHKEHENTFDDNTAHKMKKRFEILEGEYQAGNNNPLIKQELHELLFKMGHAKIISLNDASRYWKEFNEN